jgi:DNA-directed RNA polymerase subunit M/transcription elongation factor TFIIS
MPIEFDCENCQKLLRVGDGNAGKQCRCPACHALLTIPDPKTVESSDDLAEEEGELDQISICCLRCQKTIVGKKKMIGTMGQCRNCQTIFRITAEGAQEVTDSGGLIFNCPDCDQLFDGATEMEGRKGKCHTCGSVFRITLKPSLRIPRDKPDVSDTGMPKVADENSHADRTVAKTQEELFPGESLSEESLSEESLSPQAALEPDIRLICPDCRGEMEVPADAIGLKTHCPYCDRVIQVSRDQARRMRAAEAKE